MIYILCEDASKPFIALRGDLHKYLVKVRRHEVGDMLSLRNKEDLKILYTYEIQSIDARSLELKLLSSSNQEVEGKKKLHIGWCVIDAKSIEKVLPALSEIGVSKISFIYCERSQKNFKLDLQRFKRILEASVQQCGRTSFIEFEILDTLQIFITKYPNAKVFDFCDTILKESVDFQTVLIGCEGGFSKKERALLSSQEVFRLDTPMTLRSETAILAVAGKILL